MNGAKTKIVYFGEDITGRNATDPKTGLYFDSGKFFYVTFKDTYRMIRSTIIFRGKSNSKKMQAFYPISPM